MVTPRGSGSARDSGDRGRPRISRAQIAVLLTAAVALLSLATGLANVAMTGLALPGALEGVVPEAIQRTAGFTGALTGFLMMMAAYALRRGFRAGWYATVILLPVTAIQGLLQASPYSFPLVVLSLVALPVVAINRQTFARGLDLTTGQVTALGALVGSLTYGTIGTYALREQFVGVRTVTDALWYAVVTASTVGYGDVTPRPESQIGKLFALSYLVVGTASFAIALGTLLGPAIEARLERALGTMNDSTLDLVDDHIIVVGYGDLTEPIIEELADAGRTLVVVTDDGDRAAALRDHDHHVLTGDPSDEEPLLRAGIERARALVASTDDDAQDALAILTARELNPDLRVVAGASDRENTKKLRRAGADTVISPAVLGGHLLVRSALGQRGMEDLASRLLSDDPEGER